MQHVPYEQFCKITIPWVPLLPECPFSAFRLLTASWNVKERKRGLSVHVNYVDTILMSRQCRNRTTCCTGRGSRTTTCAASSAASSCFTPCWPR